MIADLQSRLEEYERMGVAASTEMQRVAQAVNAKNQRLRSLLNVYGVSDDEIEQYLSSPEEAHRALDARHRCNTCGHLSLGITKTRVISMDDSSQKSFGSTSNVDGDAMPILTSMSSNQALPTRDPEQSSSAESLSASTKSREENEGVFKLQTEEQRFHHRLYATNRLDKTPADSSSAPTNGLPPLCSLFGPSNSNNSSSNTLKPLKPLKPLETSCDKAETILVQLHKHADPRRARSSLGCNGNSSCSVKNTKLFQLMDHLE